MRKSGKVMMIALAAAVAMSSLAYGHVGVGVEWNGSLPDPAPIIVLPIKMVSGLVIEPQFAFFSIDENSVSGPGYGATAFRLGLRVEKQMKTEGITPLWGACAAADITSLDIDSPEEPGDPKDSYTDFMIGVYLGGSVPVAEDFDIVGFWGPKIQIEGSRFEDGDSATNFGTDATILFRWWLWNKP